MRSQFFIVAAVATVATATLAITGPRADPATALAVRSTSRTAAVAEPFHTIRPPISGVTPANPTMGPLLTSTSNDNSSALATDNDPARRPSGGSAARPPPPTS